MIYVLIDDNIDWEWNRDNIGKAVILSKYGEIGCIYCGNDYQEIKGNLEEMGVKKMFHLSMGSNRTYISCAEMVQEVCKRESPELIIFPGSRFGKAVAATCSVPLEAGLVAECIDIERDDGERLVFSRTALNSSVVVEIVGMNHDLMMCTTKQNAFPWEKDCQKQGKISLENVVINVGDKVGSLDTFIEILETNESQIPRSNLVNAEVVVCIGRGVNYQSIEKLKAITEKRNIALGCTRAVVEAGYLPKELQIGQSGKVVAPKLLILMGVSGASQHLAGIMNSKKIISINNDENAPMGRFCDVSVVADANEVVDVLYEQLERK